MGKGDSKLVPGNEFTSRRGPHLVFTVERPSYVVSRHEWENMDASIP